MTGPGHYEIAELLARAAESQVEEIGRSLGKLQTPGGLQTAQQMVTTTAALAQVHATLALAAATAEAGDLATYRVVEQYNHDGEDVSYRVENPWYKAINGGAS